MRKKSHPCRILVESAKLLGCTIITIVAVESCVEVECWRRRASETGSEVWEPRVFVSDFYASLAKRYEKLNLFETIISKMRLCSVVPTFKRRALKKISFLSWMRINAALGVYCNVRVPNCVCLSRDCAKTVLLLNFWPVCVLFGLPRIVWYTFSNHRSRSAGRMVTNTRTIWSPQTLAGAVNRPLFWKTVVQCSHSLAKSTRKNKSLKELNYLKIEQLVGLFKYSTCNLARSFVWTW